MPHPGEDKLSCAPTRKLGISSVKQDLYDILKMVDRSAKGDEKWMEKRSVFAPTAAGRQSIKTYLS